MKTIRRLSLSSVASLVPFALAAGCAISPSDPPAEQASGASAALTARDVGGLGDGITVVGISSVTLDGKLASLSVGRVQSTGQGGGVRYAVATADHKMPEVELSDAVIAQAGGLAAIRGKRVTVTGSTYNARGALIATSVAVVASPVGGATKASAAGAPAPTAVIGNKRWAMIPCRFSELANPDPHPQSYFQALMGNTSPGVGDYWSRASRGQLTVDGSTVVDWQNLPLPAGQYQNNVFGLVNDCAFAADLLIDYSQIDGIAVALSHNIDTQIVGGFFSQPYDGPDKEFDFAVYSPVEFANASSLPRSIGVAMGLTFSGSTAGRFDSPWDVMSFGYGTTNGVSCNTLTPSFGCSPVFPAAEQALTAGWLTPAQVAAVGLNGTSSFNLDFVGTTPLAGHYGVAHLPIDGTHYYTLEARHVDPATYDSAVPFTGLVLQTMDVTDYGSTPHQRIDGRTRLQLVATLADGGAVYTDVSRRLRITYTRQSFGYTVTVTRGPLLSVSNPGTVLHIGGGGIDCGRGATVCSVAQSFDANVTLFVSSVPSGQAAVWSGCSSSSGNTCYVTMSQSRSVSVSLQDVAGGGGDDGGCHCPPKMPLYKCQQLCGNNF